MGIKPRRPNAPSIKYGFSGPFDNACSIRINEPRPILSASRRTLGQRTRRLRFSVDIEDLYGTLKSERLAFKHLAKSHQMFRRNIALHETVFGETTRRHARTSRNHILRFAHLEDSLAEFRYHRYLVEC